MPFPSSAVNIEIASSFGIARALITTAILAIFGAATLIYMGWLPQDVSANVSEFMKAGGFLNFYIAALITGVGGGMIVDAVDSRNGAPDIVPDDPATEDGT